MADLVDQMADYGWAALTWWDGLSVDDLHRGYPSLFATTRLIPEGRDLCPVDTAQARPGTMSSIVGRSAQPPHTDGANHAAPPHYIVLRCSNDGGAVASPTTIWTLDWTDLRRSASPLLTDPGWLVRGSASNQFYAQVIDFGAPGIGRVRFDPLIMALPGRPEALHEAKQLLVSRAATSRINWQVGATVIIDNWRTLHARSEVEESGSARRLTRWKTRPRVGLGRSKAEREGQALWA